MAADLDVAVPLAFWNRLSPDDRAEFVQLRAQFHVGAKHATKDGRLLPLRRDLLPILSFLERSQENMEARAILAGICFVGPLILVNTRHLKSLIGRCKSSINGSFQQLGYAPLRTKAKALACLTAILPALKSEQELLRQWTVRCASAQSGFCFLSSFPRDKLPEITAEELERGQPRAPRPAAAGDGRPREDAAPWKSSFPLEDIEEDFEDFRNQGMVDDGFRGLESARFELGGDWKFLPIE
jgi:hypothetical protein